MLFFVERRNTEDCTLSLHDALPICKQQYWEGDKRSGLRSGTCALASERGLKIYPRGCCATAEIGLAHAIVIAQCRTGTARDDRAGLQHIAAACRLERVARILLDQEHARPGGIDRFDRAEN